MHGGVVARIFFLLAPFALSIAACGPAADRPPQGGTQPAAAPAPAAEAAPAPVLDRVFPRSVLPGAPVALHGSGFGEQTAGGSVTVRGSAVDILSWSDTQVRVRVPRDAAPGEATAKVAVRGQASNAVAFLINDPVIAPHIREIPCHRDTVLCSIYLPPEYDRDPTRRFPVIYHFQGRMWGNRMLPEQSNIAAIAGGYGFIIVFDWPLRAKEDLLELVQEIDAAYRTIPRAEARGVWLTSASGQVGLQAVSEQPDWFAAVNGGAACLGGFDAAGIRRLRIRLDIGTEDDTCGAAIQRVHEQLTALNIPHEYERYPGGHEAATMFGDRTLRGVLDFFARVLRPS